MKKIPTIFERDWKKNPKFVTTGPNPKCAWVFAGEGVATIKLDGTSCMVRDGKLFKRREIAQETAVPDHFELVDEDMTTGKIVGWVPVGNGPEDRYHREAVMPPWDGTYELVGPKVQGNPESLGKHVLIQHGSLKPQAEPPRSFDKLKEWLSRFDMEGLVWHHPDGRMAKIKKRDFGLMRKP